MDRSLTPLDLDGSIEQRLVKTIKSIFDTHEEWVDLGKPTQMLNPSTIEKAEAKLNPVAAANRKPKKPVPVHRSEEHTSELQSLMRISYAVYCLKKNTPHHPTTQH